MTGPTADAMLVARSRLDAHRSRQAFTVLLHALSAPGTVIDLPVSVLPPELPTWTVLGLALADVDTTVAIPDDPGLERIVCDATGARAAPLEEADVVGLAHPTSYRVMRCRRGSARAPQDGARVALGVGSIGESGGGGAAASVSVELSGPGVPGRRRLRIDGLHADVVRAVALAQAGRPAGIDVWLCSADRWIAAIPRSSTLSVLEGG